MTDRPADVGVDLALRVRRRLADCGIDGDAPLVVACSGGLDSSVLLRLLRFGGPGGRRRPLTVAHFDHAMRPGSGADADWVRGLARAWGVPLVVERASTPLAGEGEARAARWTFLTRVAAEVGAVGVATGHHDEDQVETVLHNLLRGAGLRGLAGMTVAREGRVRPLLGESRTTLEAAAKEWGLVARTDPTNARPITARNRLRHEAVPLLAAIRPGAQRGILRAARLAAAEDRALRQAEDALLPPIVISRDRGRVRVRARDLARHPVELRARLIRRLVRDVGGRLDEAATHAALTFAAAGSGSGVCRLPGRVVLRRSREELEVEGPQQPVQPGDRDLSVGPASGQLGSRTIRRIVHSEEEIAVRVGELADAIGGYFDPSDDLLVLGLLKGSFVFVADLVRRIQRPLHVDFLVAASYGSDTESSGRLRLLYDPEASLRGRSVVIVEDIIDSGHTLRRLVPYLREREPRSLDVCTLLHKRLVTLDPEARWVGFDAPAEFLVGYGLDHAEDFRHLPYVAAL